MPEMPRHCHRRTWSNASCPKRDSTFWRNWSKMCPTLMSTRCKHPATIIQPPIQCHIINQLYPPLAHVKQLWLAVHQSQLSRYRHLMVTVRRPVRVPPCETVTEEVRRRHQQSQQNRNCCRKHRAWTSHCLRVCRLPHLIIHQISTPKLPIIRSNQLAQSIQSFNLRRKFKSIWTSTFDHQNWLESIRLPVASVIFKMPPIVRHYHTATRRPLWHSILQKPRNCLRHCIQATNHQFHP